VQSRANEEERKNHKISPSLYEIIGPDCQPKIITAFLKALKIENSI